MNHDLVKYSAIYRCPDEITNLKIRIRVEEVDLDGGDVSEATFPWQRKIFSKSEREFYADEKNCVTDLEKKYNRDVAKVPEADIKFDLYSYVNEDEYTLGHRGGGETIDDHNMYEDESEFDYRKSLEAALKKTSIHTREWDVMFIMADLGEYIENTWIKDERTMCTIKFDQSSKILVIYPDFTKNQPYKLTIEGNTTRIFHYYIDNVSDTITEDDKFKENELIQKVITNKLAVKKQMLDTNFDMPPKNKLRVHLFCEILSAQQFEYDAIFVQYFIDLPSNWTCDSPENLQGVTQTCHAKTEDGLAHFGFVFDVTLDYNIENFSNSIIPRNPYVYFEIISKDPWDRFRSEGLTYKNLPVGNPGNYRYDLQCFRLIPDSISGRLRRFFIGDCKNYGDLSWIGLPSDHDRPILNKYGTNTVGTGILSLKINVLHQSQAFLDEFCDNLPARREIFEKLNASSLVKSVEQVLMAFKRARKKMIEARNNQPF